MTPRSAEVREQSPAPHSASAIAAPCIALLLYCRAGFENECATEIAASCRAAGFAGIVRATPGAAFIEFVLDAPQPVGSLQRGLRFDRLVFARQLVFVLARLTGLPVGDRIGALLPSIASAGTAFSALWLETADTNEAKELAAFCRKFEPPLCATLVDARRLDAGRSDLPRLHLFFTDSTAVSIGVTLPANSSRWPMGIPRLRFPARAPSRSTLKLAEALQHWLAPDDEARLLHDGIAAVDLGAAPGGWTFQLVRRGVHVTAVDNAAIDPALLDTGLVEHIRADGFRYRPRRPVDWMVCDIVEQPQRVAALVAGWLANGWCTRSIFNLKLPMKKRGQALLDCSATIAQGCAAARVGCALEFKHLYHDREEVTGFAVRERAAASGRKKPALRRDQPASQRRRIES